MRQNSTNVLAVLSSETRDGTVAPADSLQARFHLGNTHWHSDSSYKRVGANASLLAARVVPTEGDETEWADMSAAWDDLDSKLQARLQGAIGVHSYVYSHAWHGGPEILGQDDLAALSPTRHPVVGVHPATGRRHLFIGRHASHIEGDDEATSRALLAELTANACRAPRLWKHRGQAGDIAIWDSRFVLHRGHLWPADQPSVMVPTTIAGDSVDDEWALAG